VTDFAGPHVEMNLAEALAVVLDSGGEPHRLRLFDQDGEEIARLSGNLILRTDVVREEGEEFVQIEIGEDGRLSATVKIAYDLATRCTISPDGTLTGTLPSRAMWVWDRVH